MVLADILAPVQRFRPLYDVVGPLAPALVEHTVLVAGSDVLPFLLGVLLLGIPDGLRDPVEVVLPADLLDDIVANCYW